MYAIIYFNWSGSIEDFKKAEEIMKRTANKFNNLEWVDVLKPSSEWNYAALIKFKDFKTFLDYTKKVREEPMTFFAKRGLESPPRKLELLVDLEHLQ